MNISNTTAARSHVWHTAFNVISSCAGGHRIPQHPGSTKWWTCLPTDRWTNISANSMSERMILSDIIFPALISYPNHLTSQWSMQEELPFLEEQMPGHATCWIMLGVWVKLNIYSPLEPNHWSLGHSPQGPSFPGTVLPLFPGVAAGSGSGAPIFVAANLGSQLLL